MDDTVKLHMNEWIYYKEKKLVSKGRKALYGAICSHSIVDSSENLSPFQDFTANPFSLTIKGFCTAVNLIKVQ